MHMIVLFIVLLLASLTHSQNTTFTYDLNSTNANRTLLALDSNPYNALYASVARNETEPSIVYYNVGLNAGHLFLRLNAFMTRVNNTENRVIVNATIEPQRLIEYVDGVATGNQIAFADTSTGWTPIGTGIISLQNTTLLPEGLLSDNATIISTSWVGPQQDSLGRNVSAQFNIFIAPAVEAMGRMLLVGNGVNMTGMIAAITISAFPFQSNGSSLVLRNVFTVNNTVYQVDQMVDTNATQIVPFMSLNDTISSSVLVDRNILNLARNFSKAQKDSVVMVQGYDIGDDGWLFLEGMSVNLTAVQSELPPKPNSSSCVHPSMLKVFVTLSLYFILQNMLHS